MDSSYDLIQLVDGSTSRGVYGGVGSAASAIEGVQIWTIIAFILAIIGGILVHFLFVNSKTDFKGKFVKWLKDFLAFKVMWIESILKVVYYIFTIFVALFSFNFLAMGGVGIVPFLVCLIGGPILIRVVYEASMMFIMIWRNTKEIADNTKKK